MLGQGGNSLPPNLGIAAKIFQHRCKKERSVAFKIRQNASPAGILPGARCGGLDAPPGPLVGYV